MLETSWLRRILRDNEMNDSTSTSTTADSASTSTFTSVHAPAPAALPPTTPSSAPILFRNVTSLSLSEIPVSGEVARVLVPHFAHVKELSFDDCRALTFGDFINFVSAFPHVHTLRVVGIQWLLQVSHTNNNNEIALEPLLKLKCLELSRKIDIPRLVGWLVARSMHRGIVSLCCTISGHQAAAALRGLLESIGPSLEHLAFGFQESRSPTGTLFIYIISTPFAHHRCTKYIYKTSNFCK